MCISGNTARCNVDRSRSACADLCVCPAARYGSILYVTCNTARKSVIIGAVASHSDLCVAIRNDASCKGNTDNTAHAYTTGGGACADLAVHCAVCHGCSYDSSRNTAAAYLPLDVSVNINVAVADVYVLHVAACLYNAKQTEEAIEVILGCIDKQVIDRKAASVKVTDERLPMGSQLTLFRSISAVRA